MRLSECQHTKSFLEWQLSRLQGMVSSQGWHTEPLEYRIAIIHEYRMWLELRKDFHEKWLIYTEE